VATSETADAEEAAAKASDGVELGDLTGGAAPLPTPRRIVLTTFNIRYAVGSFLISGSLLRRIGLKRLARRPALVKSHIERAARAFSDDVLLPAPHVIALQEADRETIRAGRLHVARELAIRLKCHYAHAAQAKPRDEEPEPKQWYLDFEEHISAREPGETGLAFLSRWPLAAARRVELPWSECAWRPRLALAATLALGAERHLHLFNSHIDPHAGVAEQLAQHEAILDDADGIEAAGDAVVLLGDFNTLTPRARTAMRELLEARGYQTPLPTKLPTWRAGLYRLHADWIFVRGAARVTRWGVARPLSVSDHWPVWVEIE
jgi:endonuclease/exonuclease/phosphatase family metal-dependent hydrolase